MFSNKWIFKPATFLGIGIFMLGMLTLAKGQSNQVGSSDLRQTISSTASQADEVAPQLIAAAQDQNSKVAQAGVLPLSVPGNESIPPGLRTVASKLESLFEATSRVLKLVLFYDFGTSRMTQFGAASIRPQLAKDYVHDDTQDIFSEVIPRSIAEFQAKHARIPNNLAELKTAMLAGGIRLPEPPRGTAFRLDEQGHLLIEPRGTSIPFIVICLSLAGVFLTIRMGFVNLRGILAGCRYLFRPNSDLQGVVSPLEALTSNLATSIGLTSAGAVALAIGTGGLGAALWVIAFGIIAMSIKFSECTLGLVYRKETAEGQVLGGPMRYLNLGFRGREMLGVPLRPLGKILGFVFAVLCICASLVGGASYQVSQSLAAMQQSSALKILADQPLVYGLAMSFLVTMVIFGGVRSIGQINARVMPFIWVIFVVACLWIIVAGRANLSTALDAMIREAFSAQSLMAGSFWGMLVVAAQGSLANQVGAGSSAIIHSATRTDDPVRHGMVAMLAPLLDTVLLCSLITLAIAVSGVCTTAEGQALVSDKHGISLVLLAFKSSLPSWTIGLLCGALCVAAFASCLTWSYCGERCFVQLLGEEASVFYKLAFIGFTFLGSVLSVNRVVELGDLLVLAMVVPNIIGVLLLHNVVREEWIAYRSRRR